MIEELKRMAMERAMQIMSSPTVGKLMSDPRLMNALSKGFEVHGKMKEALAQHLRGLAAGMQLASRQEVEQLEKRLQEVNSRLDEMASRLAKKKPAPRKKSRAKPAPTSRVQE